MAEIYHLYSYGEDTPLLMVEPRDFIFTTNVIAYTSTLYNLKILAYCLMDSHMHYVIEGSYQDCILFGNQVMKRTVRRANKRVDKPYKFSSIDISAKPITNDEQLKRTIAYVIRNPIDAGFKYIPSFYEWSSASLYFSPVDTAAGTAIANFSTRERIKLTGIKEDLPLSWRIKDNGTIYNHQFVDYEYVNHIFGSARAYLAFLFIKKEEIIQINRNCSKFSFQTYSIKELSEIVIAESYRLFNRSYKSIDAKNRLTLAQEIYLKNGASKKMLSRILNLPLQLLDEVLGSTIGH